MAQNLTLYKVFLASPSDVSEERNLIESSINELNKYSDKINYIFTADILEGMIEVLL